MKYRRLIETETWVESNENPARSDGGDGPISGKSGWSWVGVVLCTLSFTCTVVLEAGSVCIILIMCSLLVFWRVLCVHCSIRRIKLLTLLHICSIRFLKKIFHSSSNINWNCFKFMKNFRYSIEILSHATKFDNIQSEFWIMLEILMIFNWDRLKFIKIRWYWNACGFFWIL